MFEQVYFMTPDPQKCLTESRRVLKDGGVLACSSWKGSQWLDLMNILPRIRPEAKMPEMPKEWMETSPMKAQLEKAGFKDVESYEVETTMKFETLDGLNRFMMMKIPHMQMLTKDFSDDEKEKLITLANEEGRKMAPNDPGELHGVALVAVGRK